MQPAIYLDYNATTPTLPEVVAAMSPYWHECFGNPASGHLWGKEAADAVEAARATLAATLQVEPMELIFTSGATEALNLAILGLAGTYGTATKSHVLVAATEHKAVLETCQTLTKRGFTVELLPVQSNGLVDPSALKKALRSSTLFVAIMLANNETGVLQPIPALARLAHEAGAFFICDTTQALGKIPVSFRALDIDIGVLSAHKFYGPKGIGALYIRRKQPRVRLSPILHGGGHERGLRSGTLPVPLIVGMAKALSLLSEGLEMESRRIQVLRDRWENEIQKHYPFALIHGQSAPRLPNTCNVAFPGIKARDILARAPLLAASTGSACTSAHPKPSHVLLAMGCSPAEAEASLRFSLGLPTTDRDLDIALDYLMHALAPHTAKP